MLSLHQGRVWRGQEGHLPLWQWMLGAHCGATPPKNAAALSLQVTETQKALVVALMQTCHLTRVLREFALVFLFQDGAFRLSPPWHSHAWQPHPFRS